MKKIVVTGATGALGKKITSKLIERGDEITILTRSAKNAKQIIPGATAYVEWNFKTKNWFESLEKQDAVIHLAGENIMAKHWNEVQKRNIIQSRVETTSSLVAAIENINVKPKIFISASAVGYYGNSKEEVDEDSRKGNGFLADVVETWENASANLDENVRRVNIRIGIVLDMGTGALAKLIPQFKYFVGGTLGSGKQWFPWIHIDDVVQIFLFAIDNENVTGALNAVSPNPVRMKDFCKTLGKVMYRPALMRVPESVLKIVLGEAVEAVLGGAKVIPKKLIELNYKFNYPELEAALKKMLHD